MKSLPFVLAAPLIIAGCLGTGAPPQTLDNAAAPAASALPWMLTFEGCSEQVGLYPVPMSMLGTLPEGFAFVSFDPAGQMGLIFSTTYTCASPTAGADAAATENVAMILVTPPEPLRAEGVNIYGIVSSAYTTSAVHAAAYKAWDLFDSEATNITLEVLADTPLVRAGHTLTVTKDATIHHYSAVEGPAATDSAGKARVFGAKDNQVVSMVDVAWTETTIWSNGESLIRFEGNGPVPAYPGLAFHAASDSYNINYTYVQLPDNATATAQHPEPDVLGWLRAHFGGWPTADVPQQARALIPALLGR